MKSRTVQLFPSPREIANSLQRQCMSARLVERRSHCTDKLLAGWKLADAHSSRSTWRRSDTPAPAPSHTPAPAPLPLPRWPCNHPKNLRAGLGLTGGPYTGRPANDCEPLPALRAHEEHGRTGSERGVALRAATSGSRGLRYAAAEAKLHEEARGSPLWLCLAGLDT